MKKRFHVEVYGKDDMEIDEFVFETKREQVEKYRELLDMGYSKQSLVKITRYWYE